MKYSIPQTPKVLRRAVLCTILADKTVNFFALLFIIGMGYTTYLESGFTGAIVYAVAVPLIIIGVFFGSIQLFKRVYGDKNKRVVWSYDIQPATIGISVGKRISISYEKSNRHAVRVFEHGVYFKHKRLPFLVFFPEDKREQVRQLLDDYGWLEKPRFRISSILIPLVWLTIFGALFFTSFPIASPVAAPSNQQKSAKKAIVDQDTLDYFLDVSIGNDKKENPYLALYKWNRPTVYLKTQGTMSESDTSCLARLIQDVNAASREFEMIPSSDKSDITMHFGKRADFKSIEPTYESPHYAWMSWEYDDKSAITKATILIDNDEQNEDSRCTSINQMLAYSLGLMNTSAKHNDSVFYNEFIEGVTLSNLDRELILIMYGNYDIIPGSTKEDVLKRVEIKS